MEPVRQRVPSRRQRQALPVAVDIRIGRIAATGRPFLEVADRGAGVDPAQAERIFEPFFTTGAGGTGLGLFISRELCQTNGGMLLYEPRRRRW